MASDLDKSQSPPTASPPVHRRPVGFCTRVLIFLATCISCAVFTQSLLFAYHYSINDNVAKPTFQPWEQPLACGLTLFIFQRLVN
jgi:hypothetical protein